MSSFKLPAVCVYYLVACFSLKLGMSTSPTLSDVAYNLGWPFPDHISPERAAVTARLVQGPALNLIERTRPKV